jgi:hypothetical protein
MLNIRKMGNPRDSRMRYLAQVLPADAAEAPGFVLLAFQESDEAWSISETHSILSSAQATTQLPGNWVLVDLTDSREVVLVQDAKPWILQVIKTYLTFGITPEFLQQETERAEQWRQSLTLRSQELDRRALEQEARREQIQALEADLKREKQQLEEPG